MLHTQEVTGSSPVLPTIASVLNEEPSVRELLELLLTSEARRRLRLRNKTNEELFTLFQAELLLKVHNPRNLQSEIRLLAKFQEHLGEAPPTPERARQFLVRFADKKPRTLLRYASTIKNFMRWYGEPVDDFRVRVPRSLPTYYETADVERLFNAIENKRTHKQLIVRDSLLLSLALTTGLRRSELANLEPKHVHADFIEVKEGKGKRDRIVPMLPDIAVRLSDFVKGKRPSEKIFGLTGPSISNKVKQLARKAGLDGFHAHSTRHKYAIDLLEAGADIRTVQMLLGHSDLGTTSLYLAITDKRLNDTVMLLNKTRPRQQPRDRVISLFTSSGLIKMHPPTPNKAR